MRLRGCVGGPSSPPSLNSWVTSGMSSNLSEPKLTHLTSELTCLSPHTALTQLKEMPGLSRVFEEDQRQLHEIAETRTKDSSSSSPCLGDSKAPSLTSEQGAAPHKDHLSIQDHPAQGLQFILALLGGQQSPLSHLRTGSCTSQGPLVHPGPPSPRSGHPSCPRPISLNPPPTQTSSLGRW